MAKPKVGIFDFTGCEGCELQILNCEDVLLEVLGLIDVVNFREGMSNGRDDYEIALVEGGVSTPADIERIKKIREKAKLLVTLGSCASIGGINALKNHRPMEDAVRTVYGDKGKHIQTIPAVPHSAVVKVDFAIPGCPLDKKEFARCLTELLAGRTPSIPDHPVCLECKMLENECQFDKGKTCLGPVTRAGCEARCPSNNAPCDGCRGLIGHPNLNAQKDVLAKNGLTVDRVMDRFRLFQGALKEVVGGLVQPQESKK